MCACICRLNVIQSKINYYWNLELSCVTNKEVEPAGRFVLCSSTSFANCRGVIDHKVTGLDCRVYRHRRCCNFSLVQTHTTTPSRDPVVQNWCRRKVETKKKITSEGTAMFVKAVTLSIAPQTNIEINSLDVAYCYKYLLSREDMIVLVIPHNFGRLTSSHQLSRNGIGILDLRAVS